MKRARDLLRQIVDRENLRRAFYLAAKGQRDSQDTRGFANQLEGNLNQLATQLRAGSVVVGMCKQFTIYDPKQRIITAPCFRERVLHHAIMNVCGPHFDRYLIDDCYACRMGKGRIAALQRAVRHSRACTWALKLDIRHYFDSVDHRVLLTLLQRRFKDPDLLDLFGRIVAAHQAAPGKGLPIGSLTSQHLANYYLSPFDRFVKETLQVRHYLRYMDDSILWTNSRWQLKEWRDACDEFLGRRLCLVLKQPDSIVRPRCGLEMLGCRVFPDHLQLNRRSRSRYRGKLLALQRDYDHGLIGEDELQRRATALHAFTVAGGVKSWRLRCRVVQQMSVSGSRARTG